MTTKLLEGANKIGRLLLDNTSKDFAGIYWRSFKIDILNNKWMYDANDNGIYSGNAGIILYLIELYKATNDDEYLTAIRASAERIAHQIVKAEAQNCSFYTGASGIAYTFLKIYEITSDNYYLDFAEDLVTKCSSTIVARNELFSGLAGELLGLGHVHAATRNPIILELIREKINSLVDSTKIDTHGLYWDFSPHLSKFLGGFSHGISGIVFALFELSKYLNSPNLLWLAKQGMACENSLYNKKANNWLDYRAPLKLESDQRPQPKDFLAWCHGAVGVGLARLSISDQDIEANRDVRLARDKVHSSIIKINKDITNYTLCHGFCGLGMFLNVLYARLKDPIDYNLSLRIADQALNSNNKQSTFLNGYPIFNDKQDFGLFNGLSGIGYYYLNTLSPQDCTVLNPSISKPIVKKRHFMGSISLFKRTIIKKNFGLKISGPTVDKISFLDINQLKVVFKGNSRDHWIANAMIDLILTIRNPYQINLAKRIKELQPSQRLTLAPWIKLIQVARKKKIHYYFIMFLDGRFTCRRVGKELFNAMRAFDDSLSRTTVVSREDIMYFVKAGILIEKKDSTKCLS